MAPPKKFSGTSRKGDLGEALEAAISAAHAGLNADFVTWQLDEIHGNSGGFVGARNMTATVEASTPGAKATPGTKATLTAERGRSQCGGWYAWHDRMPGKEPTLHVIGVCTFPTTGYSVELRPATPQGINPNIYLLEKIVHAPSGPVNEVLTEVPIHFRKKLARVISHVQILPDGALVPVETVF